MSEIDDDDRGGKPARIVDPLDWAVLEALRIPINEWTSDVVDIAMVVFDPGPERREELATKAEMAAVARALRRLVASGLVTEYSSACHRYAIEDRDKAAVALGRKDNPAVQLENLSLGDQLLDHAVGILESRYPGVEPGEALRQHLEKQRLEVN